MKNFQSKSLTYEAGHTWLKLCHYSDWMNALLSHNHIRYVSFDIR